MDKDALVQNIKKYCTQKGVKPTNACRDSGVGSSFITDINRGQTPSVAKVQLLAQYLGVTTSDLLGEETQSSPPSGEDELQRLYASLTAQNREKAKDYLALLLSAQDKP